MHDPANEATWDEKALVRRLKSGDEEAFRALMQRYQGKLFSIAYGITSDREESLDLVQEVFLKVYRKIHSFRRESKLSTWLYRITINECLNWKRRWTRRLRWHHQSLDDDKALTQRELPAGDDDAESLYRQKECEAAFRNSLEKLPEEARVVFVLKEMEGLSYDEIADVLKIKRGTVSSRLYYARKRLKESLGLYLKGKDGA